MLGWVDAGSFGRDSFLLGVLQFCGWTLFDVIDGTVRTWGRQQCPSSPSGLPFVRRAAPHRSHRRAAAPTPRHRHAHTSGPLTARRARAAQACPKRFWLATAVLHHPFWLVLVLPMNAHFAHHSDYHFLVSTTMLGAVIADGARQYGIMQDTARPRSLARRKRAAAVQLGASLVFRGAFFATFSLHCGTMLQNALGEAAGVLTLIPELLMTVFCAWQIMDAVKSAIWWLPARRCEGSRAQRPTSSHRTPKLTRRAASPAVGRNGRFEPPTALQPPPTLRARGPAAPLDAARPDRPTRWTRPSSPAAAGAAAAGTSRSARQPRRAASEVGAEPSAAPTTEGDAGLVFGDFSAESLRAQRPDGGGGGGGWSRGARKAMSEVGGTRPSTRRHGRRRGGGDGAASDEDGVSLVDSGEKRGRAARGGGAARGESDAWEHGKSLADQESAIADARRRMEEAARAHRAEEERRAKAAAAKVAADRRAAEADEARRKRAAEPPPPPKAINHEATLATGKVGKGDHYAMLGIARGASADDVKRAYHSLSKRWHPDKNPEHTTEAEAIFKAVKLAYETLSDADKRRRYDKRFSR